MPDLKTANRVDEFRREAKKYVINMLGKNENYIYIMVVAIQSVYLNIILLKLLKRLKQAG